MTHKNHLGQPIGAPVPGWTPPPMPPRIAVDGQYVRLDPLSLDHAGDLFDAFSADETGRAWTWRLEEPFASRADLASWLETLVADESRVWHAYIDRASGRALGHGALMNIDRASGTIEIGSIMFSPAMRGTRLGTEAMMLTIDLAFKQGFRRMEWTCDPLNRASMRAAARLGFTFEAHFRQALVTKGRNRDKAVFAILDHDWPDRRARLAAWLEPANFDAEGRQIAQIAPYEPPPSVTTPARENALGDPVGLAVPGWTPPPRPPREVMEGRFCRLEPLAEAHAAELFAALSADRDGRVFTYMPNGPFDTLKGYRAWLTDAAKAEDPLQYAILVGGRAVGTASYLRINPGAGSIEVGFITFSPQLQRTPAATEAMYLMMRWAFEAGYRRYEWKCNALNAPSRAAALRLGFSFEGVFRQATVVKGHNRDTAWYGATDAVWPTLRAAFEAWLAPENFDPDGQQRHRLSDLTSPCLTQRG